MSPRHPTFDGLDLVDVTKEDLQLGDEEETRPRCVLLHRNMQCQTPVADLCQVLGGPRMVHVTQKGLITEDLRPGDKEADMARVRQDRKTSRFAKVDLVGGREAGKTGGDAAATAPNQTSMPVLGACANELQKIPEEL